jgi:hypothetical protein
MQRPLALAVIGGLALSTPITLFLVPTVVVALRGESWRLPGTEIRSASGPSATRRSIE